MRIASRILAVLRISRDLKPCSKFRNADIQQFAEHVNKGMFEMCISLFRQWDKELRMMKFLRESVHGQSFCHCRLACLIAAIVGGSLKVFEVEVPHLKSRSRQSVLGIVGVLSLTFGLGVLRLPKHVEPAKPVTLVRAWSGDPQGIGPGQAASISVSVITEGTSSRRPWSPSEMQVVGDSNHPVPRL